MPATRLGLALALLVCSRAELWAQIVMGPPVVAAPGIGFRYQGPRITVAGFVPLLSPYAVSQQYVSVQVITPPLVVAPRRVPLFEEYDLSGVDLDRVPASAIWGEHEPRREVARVEAPRP